MSLVRNHPFEFDAADPGACRRCLLGPLAHIGHGDELAGFVHPLVHVNYVEQRPGIEPCADCGRPMDDNYTDPNRCAGCHAKHTSAPVAADPTIGEALCADGIHEADGPCCPAELS